METTDIDIYLKSPFTALVAGPSGSGKTDLLLKLIKHASAVSYPPPTEIIYCYDIWQKKFDNVQGVIFHKGMISTEERIPLDGKNRWLIIDDLMDETSGSNEINALFTKKSHHFNISVFFVVQNLFHKHLRQASLNTHYMFLFKNIRDGLTIQTMGRQIFPSNPKFLGRSYDKITSTPFSYVLIDLKQSTHKDLRVRNMIDGDNNGDKLSYSY